MCGVNIVPQGKPARIGRTLAFPIQPTLNVHTPTTWHGETCEVPCQCGPRHSCVRVCAEAMETCLVEWAVVLISSGVLD